MFQIQDEPTYSIADAQDILGREKSTLYRMINKKILPTLPVSPIRVTRAHLRTKRTEVFLVFIDATNKQKHTTRT